MPALNIMAIQDTVRNSGRSPSAPSGILPYLLNATHRAKITKPLAASTNAQPPPVITPFSTAADTADSVSVDATPHTTKATVSTAAIPKIHRSIG
jgi:hypothetical protein